MQLPRSTPALVIGVALLMLLTTTGGAVAGGLITSKQIKNNTVTSADIKNKTISKKDLAASALAATGATGPVGPAGPAGAAGAAGAAGPAGARGLSAWDTIPSGVTVIGELIVDGATTGSASSDRIAVTLPGIPPAPLTGDNVNFKAGAGVSDADATCLGTYFAPTAPAGKVCLYLNGSPGAMSDLNGTVESLPQRAFSVSWVPNNTAAQDMFFYATWAYTAP